MASELGNIVGVQSVKESPVFGSDGCGHMQFAFIGPSYEAVFDFMLNNDTVMSTLREEARCFTCGAPVKQVVIVVERHARPDAEFRILIEPFPCPSVAMDRPAFDEMLQYFSEADRERASRMVVSAS